MPGELSDAAAFIALDATSGRAAASARTTYLALLTAAPTDASTVGTMVEVAVGGYARQVVTWTAPALVSGVPQIRNAATITFGPFSGNPPNVTHCALVSSAFGTGGDFLMHWLLDVPKDADVNESIQFAAGALSMSLD